MNEIKDIDMWSKEILYLAAKDIHTDKEAERFDILLDMAIHPKDKKVVQTLMKCLTNGDMGGVDETFYGNLSLTDHTLYYATLFELTPTLLYNKDTRNLALYLLKQTHGKIYTMEEWETFYTLATKSLSKNDIEGILLAYQEAGYDNVELNDDYPFPQFYKFFQKLLKEKGEQ